MNCVSGSDSYERIFTALAHPARRRILISLHFAGGEMTAGAIAGLFAHAWPTTTRHLQLLESAGLVHAERKGRSRHYLLDRPRIALARDWLGWFGKDPVTAKEIEHGEQDTAIVPPQHRGGFGRAGP
jgi:DNA-binding transcriptional ArsR family regulator